MENKSYSAFSLPALLLRICGVAVVYCVLARLGLLLAIPPGYATAVWLPSGVALAAVLVWGCTVWPGVFLGSFAINLWVSMAAGQGGAALSHVLPAASIGAGAALQALFGFWLIRRFVGLPLTLNRDRDVPACLLLAGPLSCLVNCSFSVSALSLLGIVSADGRLFNWWTWWLGDAIGVLIATPVALTVLSKPGGVWRSRRISVALPLLVLFSLMIFLFVFISGKEQDRIKADFQIHAGMTADKVRYEFASHLDALYSLGSLFEISEEIDRAQFAEFVRHLLTRKSSIQAMEWIPMVPDPQRQDYEERARRDGYPDFKITQRSADGLTVARAQSTVYFPVYYVEPYTGNEKALGFDLASDATRRAALEEAYATGSPVATNRIRLIQETGDQYGFLVFLPVYDHKRLYSKKPLETFRGFALGVFRIGDAVEGALRGQQRQDMDIRLFDSTAPRGQRLLYSSAADEHHAEDSVSGNQEERRLNSAWLVRSLEVPGRKWELAFSPSPQYLSSHRSLQAWSVLLFGLLFTSMAGAFLLIMTGRTARIETLVKERTAALERESHARKTVESELSRHGAVLSGLFGSISDVVYWKDIQGVYVDCNQACANLLGRRMEEVIGKTDREFFDPDVAEALRENDRIAMESGALFHNEQQLDHPLGKTAFFDTIRAPLRAATGEIIGLIGISRDVTERNNLEKALRESNSRISHLNDLLRSIQVVGAILQRKSEPRELFAEICNSLVQTRGYVSVWIGRPEADSERVAPVARSGAGPECSQHAAIPLAPTGRGPAETSARERRPVVVEDIDKDHRFPRGDPGGACGAASIASIPLLYRERLFGVLTVEADRPQAFDREELDHLTALASDIAISLQNIETEAERNRVEKELAAAHKRLDSIVEFLPDATFVIDAEGVVIGWNMAMEEMTGVSKAQILHKGDYEYALALYGKRRPLLADAMLSDEPTPEKWGYQHFRKDATRCCGEVYVPNAYQGKGAFLWGIASVLRDGDGNICGAIESTRDISENKRIEEALRQSEEKFFVAFRHAPLMVAITNLEDGAYLDVNDKFLELAGYEREDLIGKTSTEIGWISSEDRLRLLDKLQKEGKVTGLEITSRTNDGRLLFGWYQCEPVIIGGVKRLLTMGMDITERKRAEEERLLLEQQLQKARKAESLVQMAGAIAHNFNNMLGGVIGNLELALEETPAGRLDLKKFIAQAMKASRRAAEISRFMLTYVGQTTSRKERINLAEALAEARNFLQPLLSPNVRLKIEPPASAPVILLDALHLRQILTNLVSNAAEAFGGSEGCITITARVMAVEELTKSKTFPPEWEQKAKEYACVSVADTGPGMDPETIERIFDPFFTTRFVGRGLGLAVVIGLVRSYEGVIAVESAPGRGTSFGICFPIPELEEKPFGDGFLHSAPDRERRNR